MSENENDSDDVFDPHSLEPEDPEVFNDEQVHFSPMNSSDSDTDIASQQLDVMDADANNESEREIVDYDRDLPGEHAYLGQDMISISGCLVLEQDAVYELPLLAHHSIIFPNEVLPMMPHITHATRLCKEIEGSHVFGLVCPDETSKRMFEYGVICQIFEREPDHDTDIIRIKARGRQRFQVLGPMRGLRDYLNITNQRVRILPDFTLSNPLSSVQLSSLNKYRYKYPIQNQKLSALIKQRDACLSSWPMFVFNQYNLENMVQRIQRHFRQLHIGMYINN